MQVRAPRARPATRRARQGRTANRYERHRPCGDNDISGPWRLCSPCLRRRLQQPTPASRSHDGLVEPDPGQHERHDTFVCRGCHHRTRRRRSRSLLRRIARPQPGRHGPSLRGADHVDGQRRNRLRHLDVRQRHGGEQLGGDHRPDGLRKQPGSKCQRDHRPIGIERNARLWQRSRAPHPIAGGHPCAVRDAGHQSTDDRPQSLYDNRDRHWLRHRHAVGHDWRDFGNPPYQGKRGPGVHPERHELRRLLPAWFAADFGERVRVRQCHLRRRLGVERLRATKLQQRQLAQLRCLVARRRRHRRWYVPPGYLHALRCLGPAPRRRRQPSRFASWLQSARVGQCVVSGRRRGRRQLVPRRGEWLVLGPRGWATRGCRGWRIRGRRRWLTRFRGWLAGSRGGWRLR